jgi:hypothetical protein
MGKRCAQMIDISVEIAEGQLKRFIEKRARFFERERANAAAAAHGATCVR